MRTISQMFRMLLMVLLRPALFLGYALYKVGAVNKDLQKVNVNRYTSNLLTGELRQSSVDLSRLARVSHHHKVSCVCTAIHTFVDCFAQHKNIYVFGCDTTAKPQIKYFVPSLRNLAFLPDIHS